MADTNGTKTLGFSTTPAINPGEGSSGSSKTTGASAGLVGLIVLIVVIVIVVILKKRMHKEEELPPGMS